MPIKLYWCRGKGGKDSSKRNFGDYLSPLIVEMVSRKEVIYAPIKSADMISLGTILGKETKSKKFLFLPRPLHVWGSGIGKPSEICSSHHYYHAVRGKKTHDQIVGSESIQPAYGDPGLLSNEWWTGKGAVRKKYRLGVVPHYVDQDAKEVEFLKKIPGIKIIDVFSEVKDVLREIQECEFIISSSMHGLIVADSFGVPNNRVKFSDGIIDNYKFVDYYSAFNLEEPAPFHINESFDLDKSINHIEKIYSRPNLSTLSEKLAGSFPTF